MKLRLEHIEAFYNRLNEMADEDGKVECQVTKEWEDLGYPLTDYSRARRALLSMECVIIESQGSRGSDSVWHLLRAPDLDLWTSRDEGQITVRQLRRYVDELYDAIVTHVSGVNIAQEFAAVNERFNRIEHRLNMLEEQAGLENPYKDVPLRATGEALPYSEPLSLPDYQQ